MGSAILAVKNRTNKPFEFMYDGQVHIVPAGEVCAFPDYIATHGINKSLISFDLNSGKALRALCLADSPDAETEVDARKPNSELIEREGMEGKFETVKFSNPDEVTRRVNISSPFDVQE